MEATLSPSSSTPSAFASVGLAHPVPPVVQPRLGSGSVTLKCFCKVLLLTDIGTGSAPCHGGDTSSVDGCRDCRRHGGGTRIRAAAQQVQPQSTATLQSGDGVGNRNGCGAMRVGKRAGWFSSISLCIVFWQSRGFVSSVSVCVGRFACALPTHTQATLLCRRVELPR